MNREILDKIAQARILFKGAPSRRELARLKGTWPLRRIRVRPHRNHSFEYMATAAEAWAAYADFKIEWQDAPYDDALSMSVSGPVPEFEFVWYDVESLIGRPRLDWVEWMTGRLHTLRKVSPSPILVAIVGHDAKDERRLIDATANIPGLRVAPTLEPLSLIKDPFDSRLKKISGSRLTEAAHMTLAKHLACRWAPALMSNRIKAVIVDLDETLYSGVLGEDGIAVGLTAGHAALQSALLRLKTAGVFLAVVSKNEPQDVEALFKARTDFPLKLADFSIVEAGWENKAEAIWRACCAMKIHHADTLFIDDNPGELLDASERLPEISLLHASKNPSETLAELEFFPGLWNWGPSSDDLLRVADLKADEVRTSIQVKSADRTAYLRELAPEMEVWANPAKMIPRLAELSQKTNQFNLNLSRLKEVEVHDYVTSNDGFAVAIGLRDRLTDSGIIAAMFGRQVDSRVVVEEWVISCRALGREMEDLMAANAVAALEHLGAPVIFRYRQGPRNAPALQWLARLSGASLVSEGAAEVKPAALSKAGADLVRVTVHRHERS